MPLSQASDARYHERLVGSFIGSAEGAHRGPKTGNLTNLDYFLVSEGLAAVITKAEVGPRPRAQQ
eukprot:3536194-Pyramimonas_sp.AAC.1